MKELPNVFWQKVKSDMGKRWNEPAGKDNAGVCEIIESLQRKPYWIIDILPERVPKDSAGQYFAVEKYFLQPSMITDIHRRFADVLLKLNCYSDFRVFFADSGQAAVNPPPEQLVSRIVEEQNDLCIILAEEDVLITLNHDDTYMSVYNPSDTVLNRIRNLASASGLFLWQ